MKPQARLILVVSLLAAVFFGSQSPYAEESLRGPEIQIRRAAGPITLDGDLSDPGWQGANRVEEWIETRPGDNVPPKVRTVGDLTFDEKYFYAALECFDPEPTAIRAPLGDRDDINAGVDYAGVILDPRNDGRAGILFLSTPRGTQYDAVNDDATGNEDGAPDFYWDSVGRITRDGWILEMRIPFSSLRYSGSGPQTWGFMFYRNYPREERYTLFSTRLPRGTNCFICHQNSLTGLDHLPSAEQWILAPYASAKRQSVPQGAGGGPLLQGPLHKTGGVDAKWIPSPDHVVDLTYNPDFSQIESDVVKVSANERFAIFYPEKRPFFLEGTELFSTPIQAVYTRTITAPRWGVRATGKTGGWAYTALLADDRGGGSVINPGPYSSELVDQNDSSKVFVGRARRDIGSSFISFLATDREIRGGGFNRVLGPDFQWRPNANDSVTGQVLFSMTRVPVQSGSAIPGAGRKSQGLGLDVSWSHSTRGFDSGIQIKAFGNGFRADTGFVPQVGYREGYLELGYSWHPQGFLSRFRAFTYADYMEENNARVLRSLVAAGCGMDGRWNLFARFWFQTDRWRVGDRLVPKQQFKFILQATPSLLVSGISLEGSLGEEIDFENGRPGNGGNLVFSASIRPTNEVSLQLDGERRWLDVRPGAGGPWSRLFTAQVERLKATYNFSSRSFLRLIGQYDRARREKNLYSFPVEAQTGSFAASALFSYKLNWQSVLFFGYGDSRALRPDGGFDKTGREFFLKLSYAFQA